MLSHTLCLDRRRRLRENVLEKINEQFCIKVHNIITSSNFLIYEGKSFSTAAHIVKWDEWCVSFYCFTASTSTSSLSRPNNLQLVSKSNNNNGCATTLWERQNTHSFTHLPLSKRVSKQKSFSIEIETFPWKCRPRPSVYVRQFPSFRLTFAGGTRNIDFSCCIVFSLPCHHFDGYTTRIYIFTM